MAPGSPRAAYEATTQGVTVRVRPTFLPDQSDATRPRYMWAYTVEIENRSGVTLQLMRRRWIITDGLNRTEEVVGDGVVGEQPSLKSGEAFRYTSSCPLSTPSGTMRGAYTMVADDGAEFAAEIPEFSLHLPDAARRMN
ncbi:MAG TPA: Co2+/Mg2+ efflux protein ApaG [Caulobacteraceae bacterium]|jgi:ApaG protein